MLCYSLPSIGITLLLRYYEVIRLPVALDFLLYYQLELSYFLCVKSNRVSHVDCIISMYSMRWSPTPGKSIYSRLTNISILFSTQATVSTFPMGISRLNPFSFTLTAYYLTVYA